MKKIAVVCAGFALALGASMAHATKPGNNGGGNGGCGVGQTTNGCGGSGSNTATGGAGGNGYGGTGVGVGVGIGQGGAGGAGGQGGQGGQGGSVLGSGNSSNVNANTNKQAQGQMQGQQQGQAQSSKNANRNDNRSQATGGNSNATGGASHASNSNSNANSGNNSDQSVTVNGDSYDAPRIPVATAYAPNIAPTAVCMGSTSAGGQGMTFGVSFGTSWTDDNCMLLEQVRTVATVIGDKEIAAEMMCDVKAYAAARARAGKPCGQAQVAAATTPAQAVGVAESHQPKYVASAPIVVSPVAPRIERFRVTVDGLQPL